jgi:hypothetical protein
MFAHLGLVSRPLTPAIRYEIAVFFRSDRRLADPARLFLGLLEETLLNPNGIPQTA